MGGTGTTAVAKTPINTLIASWQEQPVPVKDTQRERGWGRGEVGGAKVSHGDEEQSHTLEFKRYSKSVVGVSDGSIPVSRLDTFPLKRPKIQSPQSWLIKNTKSRFARLRQNVNKCRVSL